MALSDFIPQDQIDDYLATSPEVLAGKLELAREVAEYARSIAPVDSGEYKDGIKVRRYGRNGVGVVFTADHSNIVEYGSEHSPEYAVRRKTIEHFGGDGE